MIRTDASRRIATSQADLPQWRAPRRLPSGCSKFGAFLHKVAFRDLRGNLVDTLVRVEINGSTRRGILCHATLSGAATRNRQAADDTGVAVSR